MWVKSGTWSEVFSSAETADQSNLSSHTILKCVDKYVFAGCAWFVWCVFVLDSLRTSHHVQLFVNICVYVLVWCGAKKYRKV